MGVWLAVLLASAVTQAFEILDITQKEWIEPGYEVADEGVIDPLEYGVPYNGYGTPAVRAHLSFVQVDSTEAWRVVFVLKGEVVVLQEGADVVEIPVSIEIESCAFSTSGEYIVVHDGAHEYTGQNAARINTYTGEVEVFDSQPGGQCGPRNIVVSNSGSVLCGWTFFDENLDLIGRGADLLNPIAPVVSCDGNYWAAVDGAVEINLMDSNGRLIWSRMLSETLSDFLLFSPNESLLAVPLDSGIEIWDVETGETLWSDVRGRGSIIGLLFIDDENLAYSCSKQIILVSSVDRQPVPEVFDLDIRSRLFVRPFASSLNNWMIAIASNRCFPNETVRFLAIAPDRSLIWVSSASSDESVAAFGGDRPVLWSAAAVSSDAERILITVLGCVLIKTIGEAAPI